MYTAWVGMITPRFVFFHAGVTKTTFIAVRHPDGTLTDDTNKRILVFEYLGEV
jgi:hypothetical protein